MLTFRRYRPIPARAIRIPLPDTTQRTDYSCGASSLQAIAKYYGVGPDDEWQFVDDTGMDHRVGAHPDQLRRAAESYGLRCHEYHPMSLKQLLAEIRRKHPVLVMIQAWGTKRRRGRIRPILDYRKDWKDGHWVVAIGFDSNAVYFEDPSLQAVRGYLRYSELDKRWRDTVHHGKHMPYYGMAIWHARPRANMYTSRAERIQ
jgi:uncharacterized protein